MTDGLKSGVRKPPDCPWQRKNLPIALQRHFNQLLNFKSKAMLQTIIALLIALGMITSQADFDSRSQQEQDAMIQIVIDDVNQ